MREVNLIDLVAGFEQHQALRQIRCRQMREQPIELIAGQRGEQFVIQGMTGV